VIRKWYKEANSENKVLAAYYGQSTNTVKISCIAKAIEFSVGSVIKEKDIEELNLASPWITVDVKDLERAKALINYETVITMERRDLVTFQSITNR